MEKALWSVPIGGALITDLVYKNSVFYDQPVARPRRSGLHQFHLHDIGTGHLEGGGTDPQVELPVA
jgi:hypothetical protein